MTERIITDSNGRKHITNEPQLHPTQRTWVGLQRTWVGLTDEEIDELRSGYQSGRIGSFVALARAIEAKLKERNT